MLNPGLTGAKRQSWEKYNPRDVLRDCILSKPRASEMEIREMAWEIIRNEKGYLQVIFDYWFTNNYRQFFVEEINSHSTAVYRAIHERSKGKAEKNSAAKPTREEINNAKDSLRPMLMDHTLSSGVILRNASFGECAVESGWLREVAKQGKPNAIVGKHLTEKDLLSLKKRIMK